MSENNYLKNYLKAIVEVPIRIIFTILDIVSVASVFIFVADDWKERLILAIFVFVIHLGHFLIFRNQQITISKLQKQVNEFQSREPDLELFAQYSGVLSKQIVLQVPPLKEEPDYEKIIQKESKKLEEAYRKPNAQSNSPSTRDLLKVFSQSLYGKKKNKEKYEKECKEYLEELKNHLRSKYYSEAFESRYKSISFVIRNSGQAPADDITIFFNFPQEFHFPTEDELFELELYEDFPDPPDKPTVFESPFEGLESIASGVPLSHISTLTHNTALANNIFSNVRGPSIHRGNRTKIEFEISKLVQGLSEELDEIDLLITDDAIGKKLNIPVKIHTSSIPHEINQTVTIDIYEE